MSDSDFEPKDELKRSLEEFQFKKRLQSQSSSEDVFSPLSSPRKLSNDTEAKSVESQPTTSWTVVDVASSSPPKQELPKLEPPKQEASKIVIERAKPQVPTKPKPPPPPPKSKSPSKELSSPKYPVTTTATYAKSGNNVAPPKRVSDYEEIKIVANTSKEELPKLELKSDSAESKTIPSTSPNGGVRGMMSLFEGGKQQMPLYSKPDMSQKKPKSFFTSEVKAPSVTEKTKDDEDIVEASPAIPDRKYTEEDVSSLSPTPTPSPPPPPVRNSSPQMSPKQNRFNSLKNSTSPGNSTQNNDENPYEVVAPRQKETSPVPPTPPLHQRRFESRHDMPPAPPSPFRDRRPVPPTRDVSLASSSPSFPSAVTIDSDYAEVGEPVRRPLVSMASSSPSFPPTVTIDSDYAEVGESVRRPLISMASSSPSLPSTGTIDSDYAEVAESVRRPLVSNESPYSDVEVTAPIQNVEAYYTTDILRNLLTKTGGDAKRVPPPKPLPFQLKSTVEDDSKPKTLSDPKPVRKPPPKPAPYRPKTFQEDLPNNAVPSDEGKLQSPVSPTSPRVPVVMPGLPRLSSARIVSDSEPSSTSSSPNLERSPKLKLPPPPPVRVSSIADVTRGEGTQAAKSPVEENRLNSYSPVNGVLEHYDKNEIPTRDFDTTLSSKPNLPRKPQFGSRPSHAVEDTGPPSFKPPPPPKLSSAVPRAYGVQSGSVSPDRERAVSQNGTDSYGIIAPPPMEWMDGKNGRSSSKTSVDSQDLKIVPPPPVPFKELDNNSDEQTVSLAFDIPTVNPPSGWQEGPDDTSIKNASVNSRKSKSGFKKGYWKSTGNVDYDIAIVPPPPPSEPPPTLPLSDPLDYELDLVPSPLSDGPGGLNLEDILGDLDNTLLAPSDDEDLPPAPLPPGERYAGVPPPPGDGISKPLVPPLRKQR